MKRLLKVLGLPALVAAAATSAPVFVDPAIGLRASAACAQKVPTAAGTCCHQQYALCIIGQYKEYNRYYLSEGACPSSS